VKEDIICLDIFVKYLIPKEFKQI
jgi:hypothetical protein